MYQTAAFAASSRRNSARRTLESIEEQFVGLDYLDQAAGVIQFSRHLPDAAVAELLYSIDARVHDALESFVGTCPQLAFAFLPVMGGVEVVPDLVGEHQRGGGFSVQVFVDTITERLIAKHAKIGNAGSAALGPAVGKQMSHAQEWNVATRTGRHESPELVQQFRGAGRGQGSIGRKNFVMPQRDPDTKLAGVDAVDEIDAAGHDGGGAAAVPGRELDITDDGHGHGQHGRALKARNFAQVADEIRVVGSAAACFGPHEGLDAAVVDQRVEFKVGEPKDNGPVARYSGCP